MGILNVFKGKSPEEIEKKGDRYSENREYGLAILEYEKALLKLEKKPPSDTSQKKALEEKMAAAKESLARQHFENAGELMAEGVADEAEELLTLAGGLTKDSGLLSEIERGLAEIRQKMKQASRVDLPAMPDPETEAYIHSEEEHFSAIISSLPPEESSAYRNYGDHFKTGYVALHNGDFETAAEKFVLAMDENSDEKSYIPLELATARINLGRHDEALSLLEAFISDHPESTRAYTLMCEILWERGAFEKVHDLLSTCRPEMTNSIPMKVLQGETFFLQKKFDQAVALYHQVLEAQGWDEQIARFLAKTYEVSGSNKAAREIYQTILGKCQGCGRRPDPYILQRYAETSFADGDYSTRILEIYLDLTKKDVENRGHYFRKISEIYSHMGNDKEAKRFAGFAEM